MDSLKKKYAFLAPQVQYLCDEVVLAQAWKKSHTYISRYNWYADTLELDCSAIALDQKLTEWRTSLAKGNYQPAPSWLIPAPKSGPWIFDDTLPEGWGPKPERQDDGIYKAPPLVLRPLAHLGIREQTCATAVMLCLADCIETAQGDTSTKLSEAAKNNIYSYGNRLFCNWDENSARARFSWGNSNVYSRYFKDYQQFVARPNEIARVVDKQKKEGELVFVVKVDLSAFFDNIDLDRLIRCLKREYATFRKTDKSLPIADSKFWTLARQILNFSWRAEDVVHGGLFRGGVLPQGLPQGLVASGFFANAYMLDFDRAIGEALERIDCDNGDAEIFVHDYCRYVDDIRLVISVQTSNRGMAETTIARVVVDWIQQHLDDSINSQSKKWARLCINDKKTELELYSAIAGDTGVATRMKSLQQQLSGPVDVATLHELETGLNGLLALAELGLNESSTTTATNPALQLASVAKPKLEVRDDTLTRFSAYRLAKSLRIRRSMTNLAEDGFNGPAKEALLHDFEVTARRLVAAWAGNPSLVQVLRYAMDLFPTPDLLDVVTNALTSKLKSTSDRGAAEQAVIFYVLAELFKAGAIETGKSSTLDPSFSIGDVVRYRENLAVLAQTMLEIDDVPWYVQQQASLLLASMLQSSDSLSAGEEMRFHRALHAFLQGRSSSAELSPTDEVSISLVGHQLQKQPSKYVKWFKQFQVGKDNGLIRDALQLIGQTDQQLFNAVTRPGKGAAAVRDKIISHHLGYYIDARWPDNPQPLPTNVWISFAKVITHPEAVFEQENALLQLGVLLASLPKNALKRPESMTPVSIELRCSDWSKLLNPGDSVLEMRYVATQHEHDPLYVTPSWCTKTHAWMYAIGRLMRSAATGELDFTARHWLLRDDTGWYSNIRSTWHKRRIGMMHAATSLGGTTNAVTPWLSKLLVILLRWPGTATDKISDYAESISTAGELASFFKRRLLQQAALFGKNTNLPVYRFPVNWELNDSRTLRVVLVQGLMPSEDDFNKYGIAGLNEPEYRKRHRNHTAALLHLVHRQLLAYNSVQGLIQKPHVDLVIFPEYSVHIEDQDLMRAFSDSTGAMLFYGLLGATVPKSTKLTNMARWLIPQQSDRRRSWLEIDQGKWHLTEDEEKLGVSSWRPYQVVIELNWGNEAGYRISGAVCYDATDIALAADLKDETHMFIVAAMNKDVKTFDSMVSALRYHMYQHILIANSGEFGGSTAQAPYDQEHRRLVSHVHGNQQIAASVFDIKVDDFGPNLEAAKPGTKVTEIVSKRIGKTRPAGLKRKN